MSDAAPRLHALLIGVCGYPQSARPDRTPLPPLFGSVGDVQRVQAFLERFLAVPAERIATLTASGDGRAEPPEPPERRPTYANLVAAFRRLAETAEPGDQVYIHYSGHGRRAATDYPELKGDGGFDEVLVPYDVDEPGGRYLRDVEISFLLDRLLERGLIVTLTLDCCHAGGATRGQARPRGVPEVDAADRSTPSAVASRAELLAGWRGGGRRKRAAVLDRHGLELSACGLAPREGLVVLAACRPQEVAYENEFPPDGTCGVLTYWWLDTLRQSGPLTTYKQVHDRLLARVNSEFANQAPMLLGDVGRVVFGFDHRAPCYAVRVFAIDEAADQVTLSTGELEGVRAGSRFAVFPLGGDISRRGDWIAQVEIDESGLEAQSSRARIQERRPLGEPEPIEPGALAVLLDPGSIDLKSGVELLERPHLPASIPQRAALAEVRSLIEAGGGFLYRPAAGEKLHFYVAVDARGCHEILDAAQDAVPNLRPPLPIDDSESAVRVVQRLIHLTKFRNIAQVDVLDPSAEPTIQIDARLLGYQAHYVHGQEPRPLPFPAHGNLAEVEAGEWVVLQIESRSSSAVDVTILNLQPDWSIAQIYPTAEESFLWPFVKDRLEGPFALRADLPQGCTEGTEILKVIATPRSPDFRWLELPPLDQPPPPPHAVRTGDPLERLFLSLSVEAPAENALRHGEVAGPEWATVQVQVRVLPRGALQRGC